jgi:CRP/FNR family transcriptional regulator, anaerobic regulatory protein
MEAGSPVETGFEAFDPIPFSCIDCAVGDRCLASALPASARARLGRVATKRLDGGHVLYRAGDVASAIYLIRRGSFKSQIVSEDGREQISAIRLRGCVIGIEGIASGRHTHTAVALERSAACVIPVAVIDRLAAEEPGVQRWFHRVLSRAIVAATEDMILLGRRKAEERLGAFLADLSRRLAVAGDSPRDFDLRLTRQEIGSHLGLSAATVSRAFAVLNRKGLIKTRKQRVELLRINALEESAAEWRDPALAADLRRHDGERQ